MEYIFRTLSLIVLRRPRRLSGLGCLDLALEVPPALDVEHRERLYEAAVLVLAYPAEGRQEVLDELPRVRGSGYI